VIKKIRNYLSKEKKDILLALCVLFLVSAGYLAYMFLVGVPMTKAKNYYNLAYLAFQERNYLKANSAIDNSLRYYQDRESLELKAKIQEALGN
jgi:hypothetical protein